jgi:hypothetical protein
MPDGEPLGKKKEEEKKHRRANEARTTKEIIERPNQHMMLQLYGHSEVAQARHSVPSPLLPSTALLLADASAAQAHGAGCCAWLCVRVRVQLT